MLMLLIVAAPAIRMRAAPPRDLRMCATPDVSRKDRNTLSRRAASLGSASEDVQCLVVDALVPGQRFEYRFPGEIGNLLKQVRSGGWTLCVLGTDQRIDAEKGPVMGSMLSFGVEARIENLVPTPVAHGYFASHLAPQGATSEGGAEQWEVEKPVVAYDTTLVAGRRFELLDCRPMDGARRPRPVFPARVRWIDEEEATPEAIALAETLEPLVAEWRALVRDRRLERNEGDVERVLGDLGPMPPASEADARALWVAGLINPLPPLALTPVMELRLEVRPKVLSAAAGVARVEAARDGVVEALRRLRDEV